MRSRTLIGAVFAAAALALPSTALAHHGRHHHARHHAHHATVHQFGTASSPVTPGSEPAGKVVSFKEGVLTIALTGGGEVSGKVTEATRLECEGMGAETGEDDQGQDAQEHESISGPREDMNDGDQGGSGGHDNGDREAGDDNDDAENANPACTSSALVPGASVREAFLAVGSGGAVWLKVELTA